MSKEDMKDTLGARMKRYEAVQDTQLIPNLPLYARVDGRHFSKFTKGFGYPYKELAAQGKCGFELTAAMQKTAEALCKEFNCTLVETHSDEISMAWTDFSKAPFDGRYFKLVSNIASYAGVVFFHHIRDIIPDKIAKGAFPSFDCRVFQVPDLTELANLFVWRQNDCIRGCLNQYAQQFFSHKQLDGKTCAEREDMLLDEGHDWQNMVDDAFKYGFFCHKVQVEVDADGLHLPENVAQSLALAGVAMPEKVIRTKVERLKVSARLANLGNKPEFLFEGAAPKLKLETT